MRRKVSYHSNTVVIFSCQCLYSLKSPLQMARRNLLFEVAILIDRSQTSPKWIGTICCMQMMPNIPEARSERLGLVFRLPEPRYQIDHDLHLGLKTWRSRVRNLWKCRQFGAKCGKIKHCQDKMTTGMCRKPNCPHNTVHFLPNSAFNLSGCLPVCRLSRELSRWNVRSPVITRRKDGAVEIIECTDRNGIFAR